MALVFATLMTAACTMPMMEKENQFEIAVRDYLQKLRWQDNHGAALYMKEEFREDFLSRMKDIPGLNIVNVTLKAMEPGSNEDEYQVVAAIEYYVMPSLSLREKELRQKWVIIRYEEWNRLPAWQIATPFPEFP
ncbi:MAG: hypothetical protein JXB25_08345 [Deltaproteobacteria bacterium]|nr:hypothetical protein [Deltaproteobacteria bacterium]